MKRILTTCVMTAAVLVGGAAVTGPAHADVLNSLTRTLLGDNGLLDKVADML